MKIPHRLHRLHQYGEPPWAIAVVDALFAPCDPVPASGRAEKLFMRIRDLIKDRLIDPDFGPADVAAEAGMSLRYVHRFGHVPGRSIYLLTHRNED